MVLCGIRSPDFHKRILFSDEAHFWLNGYVNKQNCRIWSEANPQVYVETPLHPKTDCLVCFMGWWNPSSKTMKATTLQSMDKPQTLDHLEDNIRRVIADIRPQMLEKVIENWTSRLDYIQATRGSHMPEILFKMIYCLHLATGRTRHEIERRFWQREREREKGANEEGTGKRWRGKRGRIKERLRDDVL
ncbi:uncharacterized protein TNCV_2787661 [Trichonephila clavipes]|uniref:Uncharacterized protein n=1 Tax=Trichonephila clavipes TaxID=2585209 RepID=A0A8X6VQR2_TRICX|nr:uncharacterized protein TNCV_2787661 [Trichonephila clavipes]